MNEVKHRKVKAFQPVHFRHFDTRDDQFSELAGHLKLVRHKLCPPFGLLLQNPLGSFEDVHIPLKSKAG